MKMNNVISSLLAFGVIGSGAAFGGDLPPGGIGSDLPEFLRAYDVNNDGVLSPEEYAVAREERELARLEQHQDWDTDGDGQLSIEEIEAAQKEIFDNLEEEIDAQFDQIDVNGDGFISLEEFGDAPGNEGLSSGELAKIFGLMAGDDGKIDKEEFGRIGIGIPVPPSAGWDIKESREIQAELMAALANAFAEVDTNGDQLISEGEYIAHITATEPELVELAPTFFRVMDSDSSGFLNLPEFSGSVGPRDPFDRLDADGDGFISKPEMGVVFGIVDRVEGYFRAVDLNGDDLISREEFEIEGEAHPDDFDVIDDNGDGQISHGELLGLHVPADLATQFITTVDTGGDGLVNRAEWDAAADIRDRLLGTGGGFWAS